MKEFLLVERTGYLPNRYHWTLEDQTPGNQVVLAIDSQTDSHTGAQLWDEKHICGNVHERIKAKWTSVNGGERVYDFKSVMPPAVSWPRFGKHCVSVSSSDNGLVGFNGVLAAHLLGINARHG